MPLADAPPLPPPMVQAAPVELRLSTEQVAVSDKDSMGLSGLHYLRPVGSHGFGGVSVFGATQGDRGGFFAWGLSGGYRLREGPWQAEAGLFVGGGGGSPGWVGGGLMLRPHLAASYAWGPLGLGLGLSQVWFPNGRVRSSQPYATLSWASEAWFGPAGGAPASTRAQGDVQVLAAETSAVVGQYSMRGHSVRRDGQGDAPDLRYGGLALRRVWSGRESSGATAAQAYWLLSAAGGLSHAYTGYAELLGGIGVHYPLPVEWPLALRAEAALGSGGAGSAADTGGGLLAKVSAGLSWQINRNLGLTAAVGRVASRGPFDPSEARLELVYRGWDGVPGRPSSSAPSPEPSPGALAWAPWDLSAGWLQFGRMPRLDGGEPGLGVAALKLARELDPNWRLVGQAAIATNGGAGGYAAGQLGLGWLTARSADTAWRLGGELSVGAAGGGGVKVDGGLVGQAQLQARYALSAQWAVQADAGWLRSRQGSVSTPLFGLSAVYSFSRLQGS